MRVYDVYPVTGAMEENVLIEHSLEFLRLVKYSYTHTLIHSYTHTLIHSYTRRGRSYPLQPL